MTFLQKLRERKIGQWTLGYAAVAWTTLQLLDFLASHFAWPVWIVRAATVFLLVNVLSVLILAWYHGERGRQRVAPVEAGLLAFTITAACGGAWLAARSTVEAPPSSFAKPETHEGSIAVLPFDNLSGAEYEYFSDGITEEILDAVGRIPGMSVAARTSSFAFKGKNGDSRDIARQLQVAHLVMGSVQRSGNRVRVNSMLYSVADNAAVPLGKFDSDAGDLFAVEDSISRSVAQQLQKTIGAGTTLAAGRTTSDAAHLLYLRGLDKWSTRKKEDLELASKYFIRAIIADSNYAQAHAGLALVEAVSPNYDSSIPAEGAFAAAESRARRALSIDPRSEVAYAALSQVAEYRDDMVAAEHYARMALEINPNYATAHQWLGETLWARGKLDEALAEMNLAVKLDRFSPVILSTRGFVHEAKGDLKAAIDDELAALSIDPQFAGALVAGMRMSLEAHRYDLAQTLLLKIVAPNHREALADTIISGLKDPSRHAPLVAHLRSLAANSPAEVAFIAELAGERDLAISAAVEADKKRIPFWSFWSMMSSPSMKGLREDPRFPKRLSWPRR